MIDILNDIRRFIGRDKKSEHLKIRNVKTLEVFTVGDLKKRVNDGEFDAAKWKPKKR